MAGKLRRASAKEHSRGPSTPRHKTLCYAIDLRGASLRMTPFWRGLKNIRADAKKREKIEKVTCSLDDDFVGVPTKNALTSDTYGDASWAKFRHPCGTGGFRADSLAQLYFGFLRHDQELCPDTKPNG